MSPSCPNGAAELFEAANAANLNLLAQGQPNGGCGSEATIDETERHFGSCTNHGERDAARPKRTSPAFIATARRSPLVDHRPLS